MSHPFKVQSEVFLRDDIAKTVKALLLAASVYPEGDFKEGYALGLKVVWQAICADANDTPRVNAASVQGLTGWEDVDSGIFACGGF